VAQAPNTRGQYAGAGDIVIMLGMYIERDNFAMPVSNTVLCLYLQRQSLTVDPENLETKLSAIRYLHSDFWVSRGFHPTESVRAVHSPLVHGIEAFVSPSGEAQAPYHTQVARAHEAVPGHRLVLRLC
jgi:hypothetical protein